MWLTLPILSTINKARSLMAFIKRWAYEFKQQNITRRLHMTLIGLTLKYAAEAWSPTYRCYVDAIESVQKQ